MTIAFGSIAHTVWICLVRRFNAVNVERFCLAPICVSGRRWCASAALASLFATILSRSLPTVLSSAIGLYAPGR